MLLVTTFLARAVRFRMTVVQHVAVISVTCGDGRPYHFLARGTSPAGAVHQLQPLMTPGNEAPVGRRAPPLPARPAPTAAGRVQRAAADRRRQMAPPLHQTALTRAENARVFGTGPTDREQAGDDMENNEMRQFNERCDCHRVHLLSVASFFGTNAI